MTNSVYPSAHDLRRDALDRASRFLDQSSYVANIRGPAVPPTVADLTSAADAILAWMIQPLPGDPNAEPELAQQATNVQAAPQFRDLSNIVRHTGPSGVWHLGPYQTCTICQVGHGAIPAGSTGIAVGQGPTNRYAPTPIIHDMTEAECSPFARSQHAEATKRAVAAIDREIARTHEQSGAVQPATSATPSLYLGPIPQHANAGSTIRDPECQHPPISTYKRPY